MSKVSILVMSIGYWMANTAQAQSVAFQERVIDAEPGKVVYAVTTADVNNDSMLDAIVVTEGRVLWYEAPEWTPHVLLDGVTTKDNVCIAAHDIDADGNVDFALGAGWPQSGGTIGWISRNPDANVTQPWDYVSIGAIPWTHRMRFGDVLGTGRPQLVVSALNGTDGRDAQLVAFEIPERPRVDRWKETVICDDVQRMHNHWCFGSDELFGGDVNGASRTLIAAQDGISVVSREAGSSPAWKRRKLQTNSAKVASGGAGEIKPGKLAGGKTLLVTIEPMHGNAAVAYEFTEDILNPAARRSVLDDQLGQGHAVWCADIDRDGSDEIVIGHREPGTGDPKGPGVYLFDRQGEDWIKHVIDDGGMACEDLVVADFNDDGLLDILAGGRATHNVKIYFQTEQGKQ